jgi:predicted ribosome quality control (RQC) complex YloA/Tae2 family protein
MKGTLTGHDILVLINELQYLVGYRINNIYDVKSKTICLKLQHEKTKKFMIIDSGKKFYSVNTFSAIRKMPTTFCAKLRMHLKNKRIESIKQINDDRVIEIQVGTDDYIYRIIAEFYASGNIILTDKDYMIMTLIHPHTYTEEDNKIRVNVKNIYPKDYATTNLTINSITIDQVKKWLEDYCNNISSKTKIKQIMGRSPLSVFGPTVIDHVLINNDVNIKKKMMGKDIISIFTDKLITDIIEQVFDLYHTTEGTSGYVYENTVTPYPYLQYKDRKFTKFDSFSEAVTNYFKSIDNIPVTTSSLFPDIVNTDIKKEKENDPVTKIVKSIQQQIDKIDEKKKDIDGNINTIENNLDKVQQMLDIVKLNTISITIAQNEIDKCNIDIQLKEINKQYKTVLFTHQSKDYNWLLEKSAYSNLTSMYSIGKKLNVKKQSAKEAMVISTQKINKKTNKQKKDDEYKEIKLEGRKTFHWFEQFNWFITSSGLLVVGGKTADQNETIVKKYMEKNDIYVHSDVAGSGSYVIRNENNVEIKLKTLIQTGSFVVSHTKAWKSGAADKSWWVYSNQVSKTTESGEYVGKGSFIIRGKKNMMQQQKLELGIGILFKNKENNNFYIFNTTADATIQYAVPIVAPYNGMSNYKFKIKLVPGKGKLGKTLKLIKQKFFKIGNIYEKASLRNITDTEYHKVLVSGIRVLLK